MAYDITYMPNVQKHSGISGLPTQLLVNHSGECPLRGGYAQSLTNWANTTAVEASWHWFSDPIAIVAMVDPRYAAWHASEANPLSEGFEQAGYARYTREEWLTADGRESIDNHAWILVQRMKANDIPHKWLTTREVEQVTKYGNRSIKGLCNHRQIDPETRTDPGDNYPFDVLDERIAYHLHGAPEQKDWFDMADENTLIAAIRKCIPEIADAVLDEGIQDAASGALTSPRRKFAWLKHEQSLASNQVAALTAKVDALTSLTVQLQDTKGLTKEEATAVLENAVAESLGSYQLSLTRLPEEAAPVQPAA